MIADRDLLFYIGGAALAKGVLTRRTAPISRAGEEQKETWTRSSGGVFVRRDGSLGYAGNDVPRITRLDLDADGIFETSAVLVEGARTNSWIRSEELNDAAWVKSNATVTQNNADGVDGTPTGDTLVEDGTNSSYSVKQTLPALTNDLKSTYSAHFSGAGRSWIRCKTTDKAGTARSSWVNISAGTVGTVDGGHSVVIEKVKNYYRVMCTFPNGNGVGTPEAEFFLATANDVTSYQGDGASGVTFWGMQFEADKSFPSSYVRTTTAAATRNEDLASVSFNAPPQAMAVYVDAVSLNGIDAGTDYHAVFIGGAAGGTPYLHSRLTGTSLYGQSVHDNGTALVFSQGAVAVSYRQRIEQRTLLAANGAITNGLAIDGGSEVVSAASAANALATAWGASLLSIGRNGTGGGAPGFFALIAAIGVRAPNNVFPSMDEFRALLPPAGGIYS